MTDSEQIARLRALMARVVVLRQMVKDAEGELAKATQEAAQPAEQAMAA